MNPLILTIFIISLIIPGVRPQSFTSSPEDVAPEKPTNNFEPSLAVVLGILVILFFLAFIFILARCCYSRGRLRPPSLSNPAAITRSPSKFSGIDKTVINSLPFFRFSSLKGSKQGLECSVCLSKFEDIEILRLLPKCKHGFHIECIDRWLEQHSSCPVCRHRINIDDPAIFAYSNSFRFLWGQSNRGEESNRGIFVHREENRQRSSDHQNSDTEILISSEIEKLNHQKIMSDFVIKNRWSNVSSSDLMFLNAEMINETSSNRFSDCHNSVMMIKEDLERKRLLVSKANFSSSRVLTESSSQNQTSKSRIIENYQAPRRSVSEITVFSRFYDWRMMGKTEDSGSASFRKDVKEEGIRQPWLPIAGKTVEWFGIREKRNLQFQDKIQDLDV